MAFRTATGLAAGPLRCGTTGIGFSDVSAMVGAECPACPDACTAQTAQEMEPSCVWDQLWSTGPARKTVRTRRAPIRLTAVICLTVASLSN